MAHLWNRLPKSCACGLVVAVAVGLCILFAWDRLPEPHRRFQQSSHVQLYPALRLPRSCPSPDSIALLLAVKSHPAHRERRAAVRDTWGREGRRGGQEVRRVFLLGSSATEGASEEEGRALDAQVGLESERFGDVLQWDFHESFFNVTLKEVLFWRWFRAECAGLYVLKGDDDVFVDVEGVLDLLPAPSLASQPLYVGRTFVDTGPVRLWWNKYYIPYSMYSGEAYPPYAGGGGYLVSREAIRLFLLASARVPLFPIDDAYVGMCAQAANVSARHHPAFLPFEFSTSQPPCAYHRVLVLHKLAPRDMYLLWGYHKSQTHACLPG